MHGERPGAIGKDWITGGTRARPQDIAVVRTENCSSVHRVVFSNHPLAAFVHDGKGEEILINSGLARPRVARPLASVVQDDQRRASSQSTNSHESRGCCSSDLQM